MVAVTWRSPGQTLTADLIVGISEAVIRAEVGTGLASADDPSTWRVIDGDVILTVPGTVLEQCVVHGRVIAKAPDCTVRHCVIDGGAALANGNTGLIDGNHSAASNLVVSHVRLVTANPSVWLNALIGWDIHADHVYGRGTVDGIGFYSTTRVGTTIEWAVFELLAFFTPDPNHSNDNHTHNDGGQGQGGAGGTFDKVVFCATIDPAIGTPSPYAPNATGQAFTISPNVAQVSGLTLTDVHLHGGAAGFIAILGSKGTPTASLGTFTRVTVYPDQHLVGGVRRQVVIDPAYTFSGGFQNPDGTPITPIRAAS